MIEIADKVFIAEGELTFKASRSGGPGGQNVNKLNTRVMVLFDVAGSPCLTEEHKQRIRSRLSTRMDKQGVLRIVSQKHRSQDANRQAAMERLRELLREALKSQSIRKKTKAPAGAKEKRLKAKKHRSDVKRHRQVTREDWT
ncbi:MAG: alternative ribosome rescue aminoacyl-tRNA hydrolase ArfB [Phycisphaerales bacterium]